MTGETSQGNDTLSRGSGRPSRLPLIVVLLIVLAILLVCGLLVYGQFAQTSPQAAARAFMDALEQHDYQAAYTTLSASEQRHWAIAGSAGAEANFARYAAALDRRYGSISGYQLGAPTFRGTHATMLIAVHRPGVRDEVDNLDLSRQGDGWAIDTFSPGVPAIPEGSASATVPQHVWE